ncbi:MAG: serine--tRNA ligase, partial [Myxococcales bacterium]|nr:serine--tRNA ligase [Myxococcales bacterium]
LARNLEDRGVVVFDDLRPGSPRWAQASIERLVSLDARYLDLLHEQEELRRQANENATAMKQVGKLPKAEQAAARAPLVEAGRALRERERELAGALEEALAERDAVWAQVPNLTHPDSPRGGEDDHLELRKVGEPRDFAAEGFAPKDHLELAEARDLIDFAGGARVAGQKFYFLKDEVVLLDLALQRYALEVVARHGFRLHTTPDLARESILAGLGFNPRGESSQIYRIDSSDLCLIGTAEITLGGLLSESILDEEQLPLLYAGLSHCFRTEAGSHGKEARGLYRVHQFTKVEMFAFTRADLEASEAMHARLLAIEEEIFAGLGIPYRVVDTSTGDLGGPAYRKFDLEAWLPGRAQYGEITSTSNCTDYQARRLKVRYRPASVDGKKQKARFVHMLNGTAIACSRAVVAILENFQQADGSVIIPEVLRPWVGRDRIAGP